MADPFSDRSLSAASSSDLVAAVESVLSDFIATKAQRFASLGPDGSRLLSAARISASGGKRLRAQFCYWGYRAVRPSVDRAEHDAVVRACAAWELLHASALVHDDYMDASWTRRGQPATHRAFAIEHGEAGWSGDPDQYGAAAAILLGDLMLSWADELLRECGLPAERVRAALDVFDVARTEVIVGQFLDVSVQARGSADVAEAMRVLRFKSAKYSIERPLHLGAALAGASGGPDAVRDDPPGPAFASLTAFGLPLGEAFQLRDDQLGVFGSPEETGKPAGDDLVEGKRTVLVALALQRLAGDSTPATPASTDTGPASARELDASLGSALSPDDVDRLRTLIVRSGARDEVEQMIDDLTRDALEALDSAGLDAESHAALTALAAAATRRTR